MTSIQAQVQQAVSVANLIGLIPADLLAGNITSDQLAGNIAANKLAGGIQAGQLLDNGVDGDMLKSTGGGVTWYSPNKIVTGLPNPDAGGANDGQYLTVTSGALGTYGYTTPTPVVNYEKDVSGNLTIPTNGTPTSYSTGLSGIPSCVRIVLICTTTAGAWASGQEIDIESANITGAPIFYWDIHSSTITVFRDNTVGTITIGNIAINTANFKMKIYSVYFN